MSEGFSFSTVDMEIVKDHHGWLHIHSHTLWRNGVMGYRYFLSLRLSIRTVSFSMWIIQTRL